MKKYITLVLLLSVTVSFGQRKYTADKYFNEFAYVKSIELYEKIYQKGDSSFVVLSRLGDANYLNNNTFDAEKWYQKMFASNTEVAPEYYFKYAQSLKSNGKYTEADEWMLKLKELKINDSRVESLLANSGYYDEYTNKNTKFINIHNVSLNTPYSDYGVFIADNQVFFSSTRPEAGLSRSKVYKWNNQPYLNIYSANETSVEVSEGIHVLDMESTGDKVEDINSKYHDASAIITKDGNTMYFTRDNYDGRKLRSDKNRTSHLKIYRAEKVNDRWTNIKELPFNSDAFSCGQTALSEDEKTLYFVSDMPGGVGATDIYKVAIVGAKSFGTPENLGKTINSEGSEMFPVIGKEGSLYFSSNGHTGLGGLDVFESKINSDGFTSPVNVGAPVNSNKDDFSLVFTEDGKKGYFSSNRDGGKGDDDIYSFVLYSCDQFIDGIVYNKATQEILPGATVKLLDGEGKVINTQVANSSGYYSFGKVTCSTLYTVVGEKTNFVPDSKMVNTTEEDQLVLKTDLQLAPLIIASQIVINPIFFDFDKYNIREDAEYELEKIVSVMNDNPDMVIKIESHTDSRGDNDYNRILSDNRAKSTRDYIISRGIAKERIESAIGYGEDRLLNDCNDANAEKCSKEEHQKNRRSYFYIVKGGNKVKSSNE